jgi:hypothetical protein
VFPGPDGSEGVKRAVVRFFSRMDYDCNKIILSVLMCNNMQIAGLLLTSAASCLTISHPSVFPERGGKMSRLVTGREVVEGQGSVAVDESIVTGGSDFYIYPQSFETHNQGGNK